MRYLMGIDNGGTFVKAGIIDENGRLLSVGKQPVVNRMPHPGFTERDMEELWRQNVSVIRQAIKESGIDPSEIAGVSFSGHGKGLYLVGSDGYPAYPGILSTDNRAWEEAERWKEDGTARKVYKKTCQNILACQPVSLLAWLQKHVPGIETRTRWIFSVNDYIRFCLTGNANGEYTCSSGSNLVNLYTGQYDMELMELLGLQEWVHALPPLKYASEICGVVTARAAAQTGLAAGTPVTAGMFDIDACGLASGLAEELQMCMIAGTWSINEYISRTPIIGESILNSMYAIPDTFLIEESSPTSAGNMQWVMETMLQELLTEQEKGAGKVYDLVNSLVGETDPAESDVVFLPFINGSNEDPLARGCFIGLSNYHDRRHIFRAVYEGIVFSHLTHVKRLLKKRPEPAAVRLAGGASNSRVWVQMFADILQIPIETVDCKEQGIVGAAMAAGVGTGIYTDYRQAVEKIIRITDRVQPEPKYGRIYEMKYQSYQMIVRALSGVWSAMEANKYV